MTTAPEITPGEMDVLCRKAFPIFNERAFVDQNPGTPYLDNFHIDIMTDALQRVHEGTLKRLIINVPPRSLKSHVASVAFPAFVLGHAPSTQIITASYGGELAENLARQCRQLMSAAWYLRTFPNTRLSPVRQAVNDFETTAGGGRRSTSVGGAMTGFGAEIIIIDDPIKPDEVWSDIERTKANLWFSQTLRSRLNNPNTGAIIVVMQRLHEDDLTGHILQLEGEEWEVIRLPAVAEEDEVHVVGTPFGAYTHRRAKGEALHPARMSVERILVERLAIGTDLFTAQYQQSPRAPGGNLVKEDWFVRYDLGSEPEFDRIVQSWDTAMKDKELADYSCCTTWGVKGPHVWLLHVYRKKVDYPQLKKDVRALARQFGAHRVIIEDKGSGTMLIQELKSEGGIPVREHLPKTDKTVRLASKAAVIEAGRVHIPRDAHWVQPFIDEVSAFPRGRHDDQVDSLSQFLYELEIAKNAQGWLDYAREQTELRARERAEKGPPPDPRWVPFGRRDGYDPEGHPLR